MLQKSIKNIILGGIVIFSTSCNINTSDSPKSESTVPVKGDYKTKFVEKDSNMKTQKKEVQDLTIDSSSHNIITQIIANKNTDRQTKELYEKMKLFFKIEEIYYYDLYELENGILFLVIHISTMCSDVICDHSYEIILLHREQGIIDRTSFGVWDNYDITILAKNIIFIEERVPISSYDNEMGIPESTGDVKESFDYYWIKPNEILGLNSANKKNLRLARNFIFARSGYKFKSQDLQEYFDQKDWYSPQFDEAKDLLNDVEESVVQGLLKIESEK